MAVIIDKTILKVVRDNLCTGCGTCVGICPKKCIEMKEDTNKGIYLPQLEREKCDECGLCLKVCPGHEVDFKKLNSEIFGREPQDVLVGNSLSCYLAHATDYDIRYNSASGGLVTALLIFALEERIIDGALVTKMSEDNPLRPQPFIARTRDEIISASKSKYCPVPANIALREIVDTKEDEKFAVVGLPCHIHGIRKAETVNKKARGKIVLHFGLLCGHAPNFWGTEVLLKRLKVKREDILKLDYRGEGWPGSMKVSYKGGGKLSVPHCWSFIGSDYFFPDRCLMCCDQTAELADISFGDAWLAEVSSDTIGKSVIVSRTEHGEQLLQKAKAKNVIELSKITTNDVKRSQIGALYFKKKGLNSRLKLFRRKPLFKTDLPKPGFVDYLLSLFHYFSRLVPQNRVLCMLLQHMPQRALALYGLALNTIYIRRV